ncbi:hypothetical protein [Streptomyces sp. NPDC020298]|uniref:hypothetical protein n=1 Tax=unclassified Streptomyces TaxID=2593676 RepID=UPI0034082A9A
MGDFHGFPNSALCIGRNDIEGDVNWIIKVMESAIHEAAGIGLKGWNLRTRLADLSNGAAYSPLPGRGPVMVREWQKWVVTCDFLCMAVPAPTPAISDFKEQVSDSGNRVASQSETEGRVLVVARGSEPRSWGEPPS